MLNADEALLITCHYLFQTHFQSDVNFTIFARLKISSRSPSRRRTAPMAPLRKKVTQNKLDNHATKMSSSLWLFLFSCLHRPKRQLMRVYCCSPCFNVLKKISIGGNCWPLWYILCGSLKLVDFQSARHRIARKWEEKKNQLDSSRRVPTSGSIKSAVRIRSKKFY
jgi:hypothetical protein